MYYLFFPNNININEMFVKLRIVFDDNPIVNLHFEIKENTVLPNCIMFKSNFYSSQGIKNEIMNLLNKIDYTDKYQILKLLTREQCLI
jgi:hypothetical protein